MEWAALLTGGGGADLLGVRVVEGCGRSAWAVGLGRWRRGLGVGFKLSFSGLAASAVASFSGYLRISTKEAKGPGVKRT